MTVTVFRTLIHESFSAHQGVEDDDMNLLCLSGRVTLSACGTVTANSCAATIIKSKEHSDQIYNFNKTDFKQEVRLPVASGSP